MNIENFVKENAVKVSQYNDHVYVSPDIPSKQLDGAISAMTKNSEDAGYALVLIDTSWPAYNGKTGALFFGDKVYFCAPFSGAKCIEYRNIKKIEIGEKESKSLFGKTTKEKTVTFIPREGSPEDIKLYLDAGIDCDKLKEFFEKITELADKDGSVFESTNQLCPLSMMVSEVKLAYMKLVCNCAFSDDGTIDAAELNEIMSLEAQNELSKPERNEVRSYMYFSENKEKDSDLFEAIKKNAGEESIEALELSIVKDDLNMMWRKMNLSADLKKWRDNSYLVSVIHLFNLDEKKVDVVAQSIDIDKKILEERQDDIAIKESMRKLASNAGAVGVPLAAIYLSGSVIGVSAAGISSGLAALGLGGIFGLSSMLSGIGVAILIGIGAYKAIQKAMGAGDLEKNKQREAMLLQIARNSQITQNYLIDDLNDLAGELQRLDISVQDNEKKIQKLAAMVAKVTRAAKISTEKKDYAEKEQLLIRLPRKLNKKRVDKLTEGATKKAERQLIYSAYKESTDDKGQPVMVLDESLSAENMQTLFNAYTDIGYFDMKKAISADVGAKVDDVVKK